MSSAKFTTWVNCMNDGPGKKPLIHMADRHLWEIQAIRDLLWIAIAVSILLFGYYLQSVFLPVILALGLAYIFNPLINYAEEHMGLSRPLAVSLILFLLTLGLVGFLGWLAPLLIMQSIQLIARIPDYLIDAGFPEYLQQLLARLNEASDQLNIDPRQMRDEIMIRIQENVGSLLQALYGTLETLLRGTGDIVGFVTTLFGTMAYLLVSFILMPIYFFFFAWRFGHIVHSIERYLPVSHKDRILEIVNRMDATVSGFVRGRLIVALILSTFYCIGFWITDVPYWFLMGLLGGFLNIIPFASGLVWPLVILLKYMETVSVGEADWTSIWFWLSVVVWPSLVFNIGQFLEGWFVTPYVQSQSSDLSPVAIIIVLMCGGAIAGLYGLLLAIPIASCIKILFRDVLLVELEKWAQQN